MPTDSISITSKGFPQVPQSSATRKKNVLTPVPRDKDILKPVSSSKNPDVISIKPDQAKKISLAQTEEQNTKKGKKIDVFS